MKKKGFTLIELLAVIVILAILAFILIPVIQDLIANARYASAVNSVLNYVKEANTQAALDVGGFEEFSLNLSEENSLESGVDDEELAKIKYKGKGPTYVYLHFTEDGKLVSDGKFCIWGYSIDYDKDTGATRSYDDYCGGDTEVADIIPDGPILCDVLRNDSYDDNDTFKINTIEDLVCMSQLSSNGKTYEGKTIYLLNDIDFNEDNSYEDPNGTTFGDINGNGETEGLKTELTTSKGFNPIGSSTNPFKGTFEGYAKTISNLKISRSQNNVGLFGYNQGKIQGLTVSSTVSGSTYIGGVVGYNNGGIINEIIYTGSVAGNTMGGIVGYSSGGQVTNVYVKNVSTGSPSSGSVLIGGVAGQVVSGAVVTGVVEKGTMLNSNGLGKAVGKNSSGTITVYVSNQVSTQSSGYVNEGNHGSAYTLNNEMLNAYDKLLDTYIGGDNDNSGYYFDYENDETDNIVLRRTTKNPIKLTLKGKGTSEKPYIVDSYQHYKEATILAGNKNDDDTYKSYKIKFTKDVDFEGKHFYALGTNGNQLTSDIDGDMHEISNITIGCAENCGMISQNIGKTIEGLKISNVTVQSGNNNIGGLVGNNTGIIKGINMYNITVSGASILGGVVGNNTGTINEINFSGTVTTSSNGIKYGGIVGYSTGGEINSAYVKYIATNGTSVVNGYIGGIAGQTASGTIVTGLVEKGSMASNNGMGKVLGRDSNGTFNIYSSSTLNVTGNAVIYGPAGTNYSLTTEMLNTYDKVLDTYIGGDNDNSGYYFDYDSEDSDDIVVKSIKYAPITFTLSGAGTSDNPYIIDNYQHYKEASLLAGNKNDDNTYKSYKIKITNDIDFTGKHYYSLGTNGNQLVSDIDGDMHTLSNVSIGCAENCGLISQNIDKTIEGINISNITLRSINSNIGGLVGNNASTVKGINADNINVAAYANTGGIVGNNTGAINEVTFSGIVAATSNGERYAGIVGYSDGGSVTSALVKNIRTGAAVTGREHIGGIAGQVVNGTVTGAVEQGSMLNSNGLGKAVGKDSSGTITVYVSNQVQTQASGYTIMGNNGTAYTLVPPVTVKQSGIEIDSLTYYDSVGVLDTVIGGDNDNSGYYLQYNDAGDGIVVVKAGTVSIVTPSPNPGEGEPLEGGSVGTNPPTCVLERVISRDAGIQPVLTCTDDEGAPTIRSQWNVNKNATTNQFSDIGIVKNGSVNGNSKTVTPYWSTSDPISVPTPNTCYYFRFGAQDASGNWSYYVTSKCYYGFGRSND